MKERSSIKQIRSVVIGADGVIRRGAQIQGDGGKTATREHNTGVIVIDKPKKKTRKKEPKKQG